MGHGEGGRTQGTDASSSSWTRRHQSNAAWPPPWSLVGQAAAPQVRALPRLRFAFLPAVPAWPRAARALSAGLFKAGGNPSTAGGRGREQLNLKASASPLALCPLLWRDRAHRRAPLHVQDACQKPQLTSCTSYLLSHVSAANSFACDAGFSAHCIRLGQLSADPNRSPLHLYANSRAISIR